MSVMLEKPPSPQAPPKSSRWAWVAMALSPFAWVLAIWLGFMVLGDEDIKWWGDLIMLLVVAAPPLAGAALGVRAARSGNQMGVHAAAAALAWVACMSMFWYAANYPYVGESATMPLVLAVCAAALVAGAVEVGFRLARRRGGMR